MSFRTVFALVDSEPKHSDWLIFRHFSAVNTKTGEIANSMAFLSFVFVRYISRPPISPHCHMEAVGSKRLFPLYSEIGAPTDESAQHRRTLCAWSAKASVMHKHSVRCDAATQESTWCASQSHMRWKRQRTKKGRKKRPKASHFTWIALCKGFVALQYI